MGHICTKDGTLIYHTPCLLNQGKLVTHSVTSTIVTPATSLDRFELSATRMRAPTVFRQPIRPVTLPVSILSSPIVSEIDIEEIVALQRLSLTLYEAKAYLTLVKNGPLKASELAFLSHVPRTKLYMTLRLLDQKGLVHFAPSKPETFTAVSPSAVLVAKAKEMSNQAETTLEILQKLEEQHELGVTNNEQIGLPKEANELWHIDGRKYIYRNVAKILNHAANSVSYYATAAGLVRLYKAHAECLENARKRGVTARLLAQMTKDIRSVAMELATVVKIRRTASPLGVNFICIDGRELVVIENSPGDFDVEKGGDTAAWTTNRLLVEVCESLFDREWENSSPLQ